MKKIKLKIDNIYKNKNDNLEKIIKQKIIDTVQSLNK